MDRQQIKKIVKITLNFLCKSKKMNKNYKKACCKNATYICSTYVAKMKHNKKSGPDVVKRYEKSKKLDQWSIEKSPTLRCGELRIFVIFDSFIEGFIHKRSETKRLLKSTLKSIINNPPKTGVKNGH